MTYPVDSSAMPTFGPNDKIFLDFIKGKLPPKAGMPTRDSPIIALKA